MSDRTRVHDVSPDGHPRSFNGLVISSVAEDGTLRWSTTIASEGAGMKLPSAASVVQQGDIVYAAFPDSKGAQYALTALDAKTGAALWPGPAKIAGPSAGSSATGIRIAARSDGSFLAILYEYGSSRQCRVGTFTVRGPADVTEIAGFSGFPCRIDTAIHQDGDDIVVGNGRTLWTYPVSGFRPPVDLLGKSVDAKAPAYIVTDSLVRMGTEASSPFAAVIDTGSWSAVVIGSGPPVLLPERASSGVDVRVDGDHLVVLAPHAVYEIIDGAIIAQGSVANDYNPMFAIPASTFTPSGKVVQLRSGDPSTIVVLPAADMAPVEADADHDGVVAAADACPQSAETANGLDDADGCPDWEAPPLTWDGKPTVAWTPVATLDAVTGLQTTAARYQRAAATYTLETGVLVGNGLDHRVSACSASKGACVSIDTPSAPITLAGPSTNGPFEYYDAAMRIWQWYASSPEDAGSVWSWKLRTPHAYCLDMSEANGLLDCWAEWNGKPPDMLKAPFFRSSVSSRQVMMGTVVEQPLVSYQLTIDGRLLSMQGMGPVWTDTGIPTTPRILDIVQLGRRVVALHDDGTLHYSGTAGGWFPVVAPAGLVPRQRLELWGGGDEDYGVVSLGPGASFQLIRNRIEPLPPEAAGMLPLDTWKESDGS